jgi:glycosyltransferase involved in cell wall biosynthesis
MMKKTQISIVVPLYNERQSLRELIGETDRAFSASRIEYIFVDDGSIDGSFDELLRLRKKTKNRMTIVRLRKRSGKSAALSEGFRHASGDYIVTLDADLQDDPYEAQKMVSQLHDSIDMIVGWRKKRKDSPGKLGVSKLFNWGVSLFFGIRLHDMNSGLKVMRKSVADEIDLYGELHRFIPVLAHARGFRVIELPIMHHARKFGKSKFGIERIFAAFDLLSTLFLSGFGTRPLIVFGPFGVLLMVIGGIALFYLSILHFLGQSIGTRPLLLLGTLCVVFGVQLLSTGLLGELIISASTGRRKASVASITTSL